MAISIYPYSGTFGGQTYSPDAAQFNGTDTRATRGAKLTGIANGLKGLVSFWIRPAVTPSSTAYVLFFKEQKFTISLITDNTINIIGRGSAVNKLNISSVAAIANSVWSHIGASWDMTSVGAEVSHLYVNGASSQAVTTLDGSTTINYAGSTDVAIGGQVSPLNLINAAIAELYVNTAEYLDLSNATNLEKFRSAGGSPVALGSNGSTPTSTAPILYMKNPALTFGVNSGTGGDFTVTGTLTDAAPPP